MDHERWKFDRWKEYQREHGDIGLHDLSRGLEYDYYLSLEKKYLR